MGWYPVTSGTYPHVDRDLSGSGVSLKCTSLGVPLSGSQSGATRKYGLRPKFSSQVFSSLYNCEFLLGPA